MSKNGFVSKSSVSCTNLHNVGSTAGLKHPNFVGPGLRGLLPGFPPAAFLVPDSAQICTNLHNVEKWLRFEIRPQTEARTGQGTL
jgi:hypothetical protein